MLKFSALAGLALFLAQQTHAQVAEWGQCGGEGYTGSTTCVSPYVCTYSNPYYSQCLPGSSTAPAKPTTTSAKPPTTVSTNPSGPTTTSTSPPPPSSTGFVKTSGTKFTLNGSTYFFVGTNAYWLAQLSSTADIQKAFSDIQAAGYTTVRTWGFNDVTAAQTYGAYYQLWQNGAATLNTGAYGLQKFDTVVATAKSYGLRLVVTLTNNWSDYGGMDVYTSQIVGSGQYHDVFYTNANVITAYKKYISEFVGRYVNEPTILAWELANEPRCGGSNTQASPSCTVNTITTWASTISAYIKSIDTNHLVGLGDEGWINDPGNALYPYQGGEGIDFVANLAIKTLDFGTFHLYPESWGQSANSAGFGTQWITDHATAQKNAGKPVVLEEYGVTTNQVSTYTTWGQNIVSTGLTGELFWQAGSHTPDGDTANDGFAVYPDSSDYSTLVAIAAAIKARG